MALRVGVIHHGRITEERLVQGRARVSVGSSERATVCVPGSELPEIVELFRVHRDRVTFRDEELALRASGSLKLNDVTIVYQVVVPPQPVPTVPLPPGARGLWAQVDRAFLVAVGLSFAAHLAGAGYVWSQPTPIEPELSLGELERDRFASVVMPRPMPVAPSVPSAAPRAVDTPSAPSPKRTVERPAPAVRDLGLLAVIGARGRDGQGVFGDLLADVAGVNDVATALQGANVRVANVADSFGRGQRGDARGQVQGVQVETNGGGEVVLGARQDVAVRGTLVDEAVTVEGSEFPPEELAKWMRARRGGIQACYERALKHERTLAGRLVLKFSITSRGRVQGVDVSEGTLQNTEVATCISSLARGWVLPFHPEDDVPVMFPFVFTPAS